MASQYSNKDLSVVQNSANSVESVISFMMLKHSSFKMQKFVTNLYKTGELQKKKPEQPSAFCLCVDQSFAVSTTFLHHLLFCTLVVPWLMTRGLLDHRQQTAKEMIDSVRFQHFVLMLACAPKFPQFSEEMFPGALFVVAPSSCGSEIGKPWNQFVGFELYSWVLNCQTQNLWEKLAVSLLNKV